MLGLRDSTAPNVCPACLEGFNRRYLTSGWEAHVRTLRRRHHDFLTSAMSFLTTSVAPSVRVTQESLLKSAMEACQDRSESHQACVHRVQSFRAIVTTVASVLSSIVHMTLAPTTIEATPVFSRRLWPRSAAQLLPAGPASAVRSFLFWLLHPGIQPYYAFTALLRVCRTELISFVLDDNNRRALFDIICDRFDSFAKYYPGFVRSSDQTGIDECFDLLTGAVALFNSVKICHCRTTSKDDRRTFIDGADMRLIEHLRTAISQLPDGRLQSEIKHIGLFLFLALESDPATLPHCFLPGSVDDQTMEDSAVKMIRLELLRISRVRDCTRPGCAGRDNGQPLFHCGSCRVYRYCSKDCQREHWKSRYLPHKVACPQIRDFLASVNLDQEADEFVAACRRHGLSMDDLAALYVHLAGHTLDPWHTLSGEALQGNVYFGSLEYSPSCNT